MSWKIINRIIGLAVADNAFWHELQKDPLSAVQTRGFELTEEERRVFEQANTPTISEFCIFLLDHLDSAGENYGGRRAGPS